MAGDDRSHLPGEFNEKKKGVPTTINLFIRILININAIILIQLVFESAFIFNHYHITF